MIKGYELFYIHVAGLGRAEPTNIEHWIVDETVIESGRVIRT
jgi:hypothetical protein